MSEELRDEMPSDLVEAAKSEAVINRENFERNIQNLWGHSEVGMEAKKAAMSMLSTKTGMYAKIPLVCKADSCPYNESCQLLPYNLAPLGELCPIETAQIELRFTGYAQDFSIEEASFTDKCIISEIINCDIMMERCKALMSKEGVPVVDVAVGMTEEGEAIMRPEVSKFWEAYERVSRKRDNAYQLMMATRKDKKGTTDNTNSIAQVMAELVRRENEGGFVIDEKPAHLIEIDYTEGG